MVWANASNLLDEVIEKRNLTGSYIVKVMADGRQGFFKVSMSIIPDGVNSTVGNNNIDSSFVDEDSNGIPLKKRN